jgi:hypothetical protein
VRDRARQTVSFGLILLSLALAATTASAPATASGSRRSIERAPVQQLPPGLVTLAHVHTPQGIVGLGLHRIRYLGKVRLCLNAADQPGFPSGGPEVCANYPLGPSSGQGIDYTHLFLGPIFQGRCAHKNFLLITGVVLSPAVTASLQAPDLREAPMSAVRVPGAFNATGTLVYEVVRIWQPIAMVLRDAQGKIVSRVPLLGRVGSCTS